MNREKASRAVEELGKSPAAKWIGNKLVDDGSKLLQKCTRCGVEQELELPNSANKLRGQPANVPIGFDEKLYAWKKAFQIAHENCVESRPA
jgi:hypothetical protein